MVVVVGGGGGGGGGGGYQIKRKYAFSHRNTFVTRKESDGYSEIEILFVSENLYKYDSEIFGNRSYWSTRENHCSLQVLKMLNIHNIWPMFS